jgi:hypothetical protein
MKTSESTGAGAKSVGTTGPRGLFKLAIKPGNFNQMSRRISPSAETLNGQN